MRWLLGVALSVAAAWSVLILLLLWARPRASSLEEALRILPATIALLRRLAADPSLPRGARLRVWLLLVYLAIPLDLVPDFVPVVGYADDVVVVLVVLRYVLRRTGFDAVQRHWTGTEEGLWALRRLMGESPP